MPTRTGGSSANQSLRTDLYSSQNPLEGRGDAIARLAEAVSRKREGEGLPAAVNWKNNLDYMMERYGLDKVDPKDLNQVGIKDAVDGLDVSAKGNTVSPTLYASAARVIIGKDMAEAAKFADIKTGEPELNKSVNGVFRNKEIYEMAQRLAMKVVTETFNTVGGGQKEDSPFAIARKTENGVRVDPMQMKQDITSLFMDYAATRESVRRFGIRDAEKTENSTRLLVGNTQYRFENEIRNYGQYGKGEFVGIFDKAFNGFKDLLGKPYREERGD